MPLGVRLNKHRGANVGTEPFFLCSGKGDAAARYNGTTVALDKLFSPVREEPKQPGETEVICIDLLRLLAMPVWDETYLDKLRHSTSADL